MGQQFDLSYLEDFTKYPHFQDTFGDVPLVHYQDADLGSQGYHKVSGGVSSPTTLEEQGWTTSWDPGTQGYYRSFEGSPGGFAARLRPGSSDWKDQWGGYESNGTPFGWEFHGVSRANTAPSPAYGVPDRRTGTDPQENDPGDTQRIYRAPTWNEYDPYTGSYSGIGYDPDLSDNLYFGDEGVWRNNR